MNKTSFILLLFSLQLIGFSVYSQTYKPYSWKEDRKLTPLTEEEEEYGLLFISKTEQRQYVYDDKSSELACYITNHDIIKVNNDEALAQSNKVYIPLSDNTEIVEIKARAITRNNKIINIDQKNIKELESDDTGYKIFAIEGAEVGGEIEYYYTRKTSAANFVTRVFQSSYPVKNYQFSLKSPENLEFDFKIYNYAGEVEQTDTTDAYNLYQYQAQNIPALYEEDVSAYENSKARLEYKVAYNTNVGNSRLFTWGDAGKRIYQIIYNLDKNESKAFDKFVKNLDLSGEPLEAFKRTEHYIKTNFAFEKNSGPAGEQLDLILKNKYASSRGFTKLYAALLNYLKLDHEIVLTSDRTEHAFDPKFDSWNYLDDFLIYINQSDQFMSPKDIAFRLGTIPYTLFDTYGLFIRQEPVQDFIFPVARIGFIQAPDYTANMDNLDIKVAFSDNMEENNVQVTRSFKGYNGQYYKIALLMLDEEEKKKLLDEIVKYLATDAEIEKMDIVEANSDYSNWADPFIINSTYKAQSYIENAGNVVLFKVGEMIGPQSELYQERARVTPIDNSFNRGYHRKIVVQIPKGYHIENPEDLVIKKQVAEGESLIYNFDATYEIKGQMLEISIVEYYNQLQYPAAKFDEYRKVINAAADWNKVVLVLKK